MKKTTIVLSMLLICICILLLGCAKSETTPIAEEEPTSSEVTKWRFQTYTTPGTIEWNILQNRFDHLRKTTDGRLDIELHAGGSFVSMGETLEALGKGVFEAGHLVAGFYSGIDPGFSPLFGIPVVHRNPYLLDIWFQYFGGIDLLREAYSEHNVHLVNVRVVPGEAVHSKKPINKLADFKGLKFRTPPGLTSEFFAAIGATPVSMPQPDVYHAISTGIIDACELTSLPENIDMGIAEVAPYILYPGPHAPATQADVSVNMDAWNMLPEDLKAAFEAEIGAYCFLGVKQLQAEDWKILADPEKYKLKGVSSLSEAEWDQAEKIMMPILEEWKKKSPLANKVITSYTDFLEIVDEAR